MFKRFYVYLEGKDVPYVAYGSDRNYVKEKAIEEWGVGVHVVRKKKTFKRMVNK